MARKLYSLSQCGIWEWGMLKSWQLCTQAHPTIAAMAMAQFHHFFTNLYRDSSYASFMVDISRDCLEQCGPPPPELLYSPKSQQPYHEPLLLPYELINPVPQILSPGPCAFFMWHHHNFNTDYLVGIHWILCEIIIEATSVQQNKNKK